MVVPFKSPVVAVAEAAADDDVVDEEEEAISAAAVGEIDEDESRVTC